MGTEVGWRVPPPNGSPTDRNAGTPPGIPCGLGGAGNIDDATDDTTGAISLSGAEIGSVANLTGSLNGSTPMTPVTPL